MILFTNTDKRWLEIVFYLLCRKIFSINNKQEDIINFIEGYRWTNMFDCDTLVNVVKKDKLILNNDIPPSKHEFVVAIQHNNCRLRIKPSSIKTLINGTNYKFRRSDIFRAQMKEEIKETEIFPKLQNPEIHKAIYSFLLALRYIADIVKTIKF